LLTAHGEPVSGSFFPTFAMPQIHILARILVGVMLAVLWGGCGAKHGTSEETVHRMDVDEFARLMEEEGLVLLDVRTPEEFASGHITGARNLDFHSPTFKSEVAGLDPEAGYLVYCAAGGRSQRACQMMSEAGITRIYDLAPGIRGWQARGMPVVP